MNKLIAVIIAVSVGVIMVGSVLVPVLNDVAADSSTFDNRKDSLYEMEHVDNNTTYMMEWRAANPTEVIVNGAVANVTNGTIICSVNKWIYRFGMDSNGYYIQPIGEGLSGVVNSGQNPDAIIRISISNGQFIYTSIISGSETTQTAEISDGYAIVADGSGDFVMKSPNQNAYIKSGSKFVGMGVTTIDDIWYNGFCTVGSIAEGMTISQFSGPTTYDISNTTISQSVVSGYNDLHSISKFEFDVTNPSTSGVTHITYNYFIVPAEVTADKSDPTPLGNYESLVFTIPLMFIVSLVAIFAYTIGRRD